MQASGSAPADKEELFEKTKYFIENGGFFGAFTDKAIDMISDDFIFRGPCAHRVSYQNPPLRLRAFPLARSFSLQAELRATPTCV